MDRQNLLCFHYHRWFVSSHVRIACITYDHVKIESSDSKCGQQYHSLSFQISRVSTKCYFLHLQKTEHQTVRIAVNLTGESWLCLVAQVKNFQIGLNVQNAVLYSGAFAVLFFRGCCRKGSNKNHGQHWFVGIFCSRFLNLTHVGTKNIIWYCSVDLLIFRWSDFQPRSLSSSAKSQQPPG